MFIGNDRHKQAKSIFKEGGPARVSGVIKGRRRTKRFWALLSVVVTAAMLFSATPALAGNGAPEAAPSGQVPPEEPSGGTPSGSPAGVEIDTTLVPHYTAIVINGKRMINGLDVTVNLGVDAVAGEIPLDFSFDSGGATLTRQVTVSTEPYKDYKITFYMTVDYFGALYDSLGGGRLKMYPWTFTASSGASTDTLGINVEGGEVDASSPYYKAPWVREVGDRARPTYALTVNGGTGSGVYAVGEQVAIKANAAPKGKVFDKWTGGAGGAFANASSASTTFTMPASAATVTATYKKGSANGAGDENNEGNSGVDKATMKDKAGRTLEIAVSGLKDRAWTGKRQKPALTVTTAGKTLTSGTDYTLSYGTNKNIGKGTVTLTGKGNYSGAKTFTFNIVPKTLSLSKATAGKKQVKATWKKAAAAQKITKYQLRYRVKGASKWTAKTLSPKAKSLTIKKLKKGKAYQVQVRAYKKITSGASKGTYYGAWSKTKTSKKVK
jgi:hypothetical protein